jgi:hypothetical protein
MATRFIEVLPNRGVDDSVGPIPEMIVPLRGTNHILLIDGEGFDVPKAEKPNTLEIKEVTNFVRKDLPKPRMFQLKGRALSDDGGLLVMPAGERQILHNCVSLFSTIGSSDWLCALYKQPQGFSMRKFVRIQSHLCLKCRRFGVRKQTC